MGVSAKAVVADEANRPPRFRAGGVDSERNHRSRYGRHGDECEALHSRERDAEHGYVSRTAPTWVSRSRPMTPTVTTS